MFISAVKLITVIVNVGLWVFILPVWLFHLLRTMAHTSFATIRNLYAGDAPPDPHVLERQAAAWGRGLLDILSLLTPRQPPARRGSGDPPRHILWDSAWATGFYVVMYLLHSGQVSSTVQSAWAAMNPAAISTGAAIRTPAASFPEAKGGVIAKDKKPQTRQHQEPIDHRLVHKL